MEVLPIIRHLLPLLMVLLLISCLTGNSCYMDDLLIVPHMEGLLMIHHMEDLPLIHHWKTNIHNMEDLPMIHHIEDLSMIHHIEGTMMGLVIRPGPEGGRTGRSLRAPDSQGPHLSVQRVVAIFQRATEYPSGSSKVAPSASYERYAATTRLPNRELPSSISPGANYMSCRSYLDQVPTDRYSNRVTLQLGLSRAGNSNVQQLGITRAGNSNAYDYTEAAEQIHGLEDYRRLSGIQVALSNCGFQIVNWSLSLVLVISGARVKLHEAHPGSSESIVEIQGIPDQVKAAQSLLQGFIGASSNSRQAPQSSRMAHYF
uniref:K Homology domain-containing protein n=1 Tax=Oryza barthii TaxID=65489 RepID=A0A0D3HF80_9ORYZ